MRPLNPISSLCRHWKCRPSFTPAEMQALDGLASRISQAAQKSFPLFARTQWSFIKVQDGIEGGQAYPTTQIALFMRQVAAGNGPERVVMKKRFTEEQIISILRDGQVGTKTVE